MSYNNYDYNSGGLFLSNYSTGLGLGGLGGLGNLDRLSSSSMTSGRTYDIFSSFTQPKLPTSYDDIFLSDNEEENGPKMRLPLFSRCPVTNKATLESPGGKMKSSLSLSPMKNLNISSPIKRGSPVKRNLMDQQRIPLLSISNQQCNRNLNAQEQISKISYSQIASKPAEPETRRSVSPMLSSRRSVTPPMSTFNNIPKPNPNKTPVVKPSLDDVKDDSLVALTNKHGKGKYWFKSGCPTPDPRWPSIQQLMIGPIPGDVEYSTLRSAFLSKGHTIHLFIQNNQAWLEKNQEKFGKKQVKFGYVVYTDSNVAQRLLSNGHVVVGHARVAVKEMDGQPAQFVN